MNNSASTTIQEYIGTFLPTSAGNFEFQEGPLLRAVRNGYYFLSDEFNLASPSVLNALFPLLEGQNMFAVPDTKLKILVHKKFRFFATQNDSAYDGRNALPVSLRSRFLEIQVDDFCVEELENIIKIRLKKELSRTATESPRLLAELYESLKKTTGRITFREIIKIARRLDTIDLYGRSNSGSGTSTQQLGAVAWSLLSCKDAVASNDDSRKQLPAYGAIKKYMGWTPPIAMQTFVELSDSGMMSFVENGLVVRQQLSDAAQKYWLKIHPPKTLQRGLVHLAHALSNKEPVLLVGPSCYKSYLVGVWLTLMDRAHHGDSVTTFLSAETETSDLVGQVTPYSVAQATSVLVDIWDFIRRRCSHLDVCEEDVINLEYAVEEVYDLQKKYLEADKERQREIEELSRLKIVKEVEISSRIANMSNFDSLCPAQTASVRSTSSNGEHLHYMIEYYC